CRTGHNYPWANVLSVSCDLNHGLRAYAGGRFLYGRDITPYLRAYPLITVSALIYYPIKACRGVEVDAARVERMGLEHDRRMMVVTPEGRFLTQRECPRLALVRPVLQDGILELSAPGYDSIRLGIQTSGTPIPVDIWKDRKSTRLNSS